MHIKSFDIEKTFIIYNTFTSGFYSGTQSTEPPLSLKHSLQQNENNLGLSAVTNYHNAVQGFIPLYTLVLGLSPGFQETVAQGKQTLFTDFNEFS